MANPGAAPYPSPPASVAGRPILPSSSLIPPYPSLGAGKETSSCFPRVSFSSFPSNPQSIKLLTFLLSHLYYYTSPYTKPKYLCNNLIYNAIVLNSALHNNRLGKKRKIISCVNAVSSCSEGSVWQRGTKTFHRRIKNVSEQFCRRDRGSLTRRNGNSCLGNRGRVLLDLILIWNIYIIFVNWCVDFTC